MSFGSLNSLDLLELPEVEEELSWNNDLQPLLPHFFVARMGDAPQNPIVKTLKERQASELRQLNVDPAITPLKPLSELKDDNVDNHLLKEADLWTAALETWARTTVCKLATSDHRAHKRFNLISRALFYPGTTFHPSKRLVHCLGEASCPSKIIMCSQPHNTSAFFVESHHENI